MPQAAAPAMISAATITIASSGPNALAPVSASKLA
jgi:hypothetical protein